jgi:general secretion pathway protein A
MAELSAIFACRLTVTVSPPSREAPQYEEFYGFVQSPFTLAPDPRFLYLSQSHDAALQQVMQAIARKDGIVVLTGDVGTGKTTLCRTVLERLDMKCFTSLLANPFLSVEEMLCEILLDFGVVSRETVRSGRIVSASKHELVSALHEFLITLIPIGGSGVLIIDEAQHLSPDVLEELRLLSKLEAKESTLLQIMLAGQLNLLDVLRSKDVKQLDLRVSVRATLTPLTRPEVDAYIGHRLSIAHGSSSIGFDGAAVEAVFEATGGVPRAINVLCDRSLTIGAGFGLRMITADVVTEAANALGLRALRRHPRAGHDHAWRWAALAAVIIALIAALFFFAPPSNPL